MYARMDKPMKVLLSMCDNSGKMGIPGIFTLLIDAASEHGTEIKLGMEDLAAKNLFWLAVKTKVQITERPALMEDIVVSTWPEVPGRISCNRYYAITKDGKAAVVGKTEWAMIEKDSGKLKKLAEVYPEDLEHCEEKSCEAPFMRLSKDFDGCEVIDTYRVRAADIDIGQHMNNAAYVRMLFGAFSCAELAEWNVREVEMAYRSPCLEGEEIRICKREAEGALEIGMLKADGEVAAMGRIVFA